MSVIFEDPYIKKNDKLNEILSDIMRDLLLTAFKFADGEIDEVHIIFDFVAEKFEIFYAKDHKVIRPEDLNRTIIKFRYFEMKFGELCTAYCEQFENFGKRPPNRITSSAYANSSEKNTILYDYSFLENFVPLPIYLKKLKESL